MYLVKKIPKRRQPQVDITNTNTPLVRGKNSKRMFFKMTTQEFCHHKNITIMLYGYVIVAVVCNYDKFQLCVITL